MTAEVPPRSEMKKPETAPESSFIEAIDQQWRFRRGHGVFEARERNSATRSRPVTKTLYGLHHRHAIAALAAVFLILLWVARARASTIAPDDDDLGARIDTFDLAPPPVRADGVGHHGPLWVALQATLGERGNARDVGAMILVGLPLGHIAQSAGAEPSLTRRHTPSSRGIPRCRWFEAARSQAPSVEGRRPAS